MSLDENPPCINQPDPILPRMGIGWLLESKVMTCFAQRIALAAIAISCTGCEAYTNWLTSHGLTAGTERPEVHWVMGERADGITESAQRRSR